MRQSRSSGAPNINLYALSNNVTYLGGGAIAAPYTDTTGHTTTSSAITPGEKTAVIIHAGQSLSANGIEPLYTVTQAKSHQLNIEDGLCYVLKEPLLGTSGVNGNWISQLSDSLISGGTFTRVISVPIAISGSPVIDWTPAGALNQRARVAYLLCRKLGWVNNPDVSIMFLWGQGETDVDNGTSQANYQLYWGQLKASLDGLGFTGNYFIAKESFRSNVLNTTIQAAQVALVDNVRVFQGADTNSLTGATYRIVDNTHLTYAGATANAALWRTIIAAKY